MEKGKTLKNEHINKETKEQIRSLTDKLFDAILTNDIGIIQAMFATQVLETQGEEMEKLVARMHSSFQAQSYRMLDEYHVQNAATEAIYSVGPGIPGDNDYLIHYLPPHPETFVALLIPNGLDSDFLITAIYAKHDDQWKLDVLQFGQYGLFNKNAPRYYDTAKEYHDKGYLIDALNNMELNQLCLRPAGELWEYQKHQEMMEFYEKLKNEFNTKFPLPLTLDNIESKPQIFRIHAGILNDGFSPMVLYLTSIPLDNTAALEAENENVKVEVNRIFTGINVGKKYVFYRAYHELPDGEKEVDHYGFVDLGTQ